MILINPYKFKSLQFVSLDPTIAKVKRYVAVDYPHVERRLKIKFGDFVGDRTLVPIVLANLSDTESDISPIRHPLIVEDKKWIVLDLREVVKASDDKESYTIRNESEYSLLIHRFILSGTWAVGGASALYGMRLPHFAFAGWLSDNLTRKFGLDLTAKAQVRALALRYYAGLFVDTFTDDDYEKLYVRVKEDGLLSEVVREQRDLITKLDTIDDFCKACFEVTSNVRLQNLDYSVLVNIIGSNWFGNNGKELALTALEHPPTWIALCFAGLTQRSYQRAPLTASVEQYGMRGKADAFIKEVHYLARQYVESHHA